MAKEFRSADTPATQRIRWRTGLRSRALSSPTGGPGLGRASPDPGPVVGQVGVDGQSDRGQVLGELGVVDELAGKPLRPGAIADAVLHGRRHQPRHRPGYVPHTVDELTLGQLAVVTLEG